MEAQIWKEIPEILFGFIVLLLSNVVPVTVTNVTNLDMVFFFKATIMNLLNFTQLINYTS